MESVDIVVFGSAIVDFICYCPRLPSPGETLHGERFCTGFGGKGANQCVAAARLGANTAMIAKLGNDQWGLDYLKNLKKEGVNTDFTNVVDGETTGIAAINVGGSGDNQIVIVTGANKKLTADSFRLALETFQKPKVLLCQLEAPVCETIECLKDFQGISILNAAPALENPSEDLLKYATILCVNESEAALMTGTSVFNIQDAKTAIFRLTDLGANTVIITMGEQGAVYSEKKSNTVVHVPTEKIEKVVDTTGAGDAFIGALAHFLVKYPTANLSQVIGAACEIASISVQYPGTQASFPHEEKVSGIRLDSDKYVSYEL